MPETTIAKLDNETDNYAVYKCQDDEPITGAYFTREAAERLGDGSIPEFVEFIVQSGQGMALFEHDQSANYTQFENKPYVKNMYVSKDFLSGLDMESSDQITVAIDEGSEEQFEEENGIDEEELDQFIFDNVDQSEEESEEDQSDRGSDSPSNTTSDQGSDDPTDTPSGNPETSNEESEEEEQESENLNGLDELV